MRNIVYTSNQDVLVPPMKRIAEALERPVGKVTMAAFAIVAGICSIAAFALQLGVWSQVAKWGAVLFGAATVVGLTVLTRHWVLGHRRRRQLSARMRLGGPSSTRPTLVLAANAPTQFGEPASCKFELLDAFADLRGFSFSLAIPRVSEQERDDAAALVTAAELSEQRWRYIEELMRECRGVAPTPPAALIEFVHERATAAQTQMAAGVTPDKAHLEACRGVNVTIVSPPDQVALRIIVWSHGLVRVFRRSDDVSTKGALFREGEIDVSRGVTLSLRQSPLETTVTLSGWDRANQAIRRAWARDDPDIGAPEHLLLPNRLQIGLEAVSWYVEPRAAIGAVHAW